MPVLAQAGMGAGFRLLRCDNKNLDHPARFTNSRGMLQAKEDRNGAAGADPECCDLDRNRPTEARFGKRRGYRRPLRFCRTRQPQARLSDRFENPWPPRAGVAWPHAAIDGSARRDAAGGPSRTRGVPRHGGNRNRPGARSLPPIAGSTPTLARSIFKRPANGPKGRDSSPRSRRGIAMPRPISSRLRMNWPRSPRPLVP